MMSFSKRNLCLFLLTIIFGANAPVFAMEWDWKSDREYTDAEYREVLQVKNITAIYSSSPSATVNKFRKELGLQEQSPGSGVFVASKHQNSDAVPAPGKAAEAARGEKKDAEQKYHEMVRAAGLAEIDPSSEAALRFRAKVRLQDSVPSESGSDSDSVLGGEDGDSLGEAAQLDTQKGLLLDLKNKNCCSPLWACLSRILGAGSPTKEKGTTAPTLGRMLDKLWD